MRTKDLYYFQEVVNCRSISHAAEKLYTTQQNLSRIIHTLEKEFSITLFKRHRRGVVLTPAGETFWKNAQELLQIYEHMQKIEDLYDPSQQTYTAAIDSLCSRLYLPELLKIARQYPLSTVQFLEESHSIPIFQKVAARQYDFGIAIFSDEFLLSNPHYQKHNGHSFLTYPLSHTTLFALVHKDSPFATQEVFDITLLLSDNPHYALAFDTGNRIYSFFSELSPALKLHAVLKTSNLTAQIEYIKHSQAISFIDGFSRQLLPADPDIVLIPVRDSALTLAVFTAIRHNSHPNFTQALQNFQQLFSPQ